MNIFRSIVRRGRRCGPCLCLLLMSGQVCWAGAPRGRLIWSEAARLGNNARIDAVVSLGGGVVLAGTRGGDPGRVFRSRDFGRTWREVSPPLDSGILNLLGLDGETVLASTLHGHVYKSRDAGQSWKDLGAISKHRMYGMVDAGEGIVLASDYNPNGGHVYRSTDAGEHWTDIGRLSNKELYRFQAVADGILLNGEAGKLFKTGDRGKTWREIGQISPVALYAIEALPNGVSLLGDAEGRVFRSGDNGETWEQRAHTHQPLDDFVSVGDVVYLSAYERGKHLFQSRDAGANWSVLGPLAAKDVLDHAIAIQDADPPVAIGGTTTGRILRASEETAAESALLFTGVAQDAALLDGIEDVHLEGELAFLPCREGRRITVCDLADLERPKVLSTFTHERLAEATGLSRHGDWLYVSSCHCQQTDRRPALLVLNASDPAELRFVSALDIGGPGYLYKVYYHDGYCYVAHQSDKKVYVIDVRDPQRPRLVGEVVVTTESDGPFSIQRRQDRLLVGTLFGARNRLAVIDVKQPDRPRLRQTLTGPDYCTFAGSMVGDRYFAAAYSTSALLVFDVANLDEVKQIGKLQDDRLGKPNRCVVVENRAYFPMVAGDGIAVVDVGDPTNPRWLNSFSDPLLRKTYGIAARGDFLFIGSREGDSLTILDRKKLEP